MKIIYKILIILSLVVFTNISYAGFSDLFWNSSPKVNITCSWKDCNIKTWVEEVKNTVNWIETEKSLSEYIQWVAVYIISFLSVIAVLYIIYAWFRILTWAWDEEVLKKQKSTILYVVLWIAVIWLAYPLTLFIIWIFNQ